MIQGYEKIRVPDQSKDKDFFFEVNWDKSPKIKDCQILRVTFPNGDTAHVKREHLHAILFAIGTPAQQQKLIPQTMQKVRWYETVVSVKAKKDIHKGEDITFPIKLSMPDLAQEVIHNKP